MAFIWDAGNVPHIQRHKVEPEEAEEALTDPARLSGQTYRDVRTGEPRSIVVGETEDGRLLTVIFTVRDANIRVVTARPATPAEDIEYRR